MVQWGRKKYKIFPKPGKGHYKQEVISQLKINDDEIVTTDKEILSHSLRAI